MRRFIVGAVAMALIVLGQSAGATTFTIQMQDFAYSPSTFFMTVGDLVNWHNAGGTTHSATTNDSVPGAFSVNVAPGNTSAATDFFGQVGTYAYHCTFHPTLMKGVINVKIAVDATSKPLFSTFTLTWSDTPVGASGSNFDIQVKDPGSDRFVTLVRDTADAGMVFVPARKGTYLLRGRFQDPIPHTATGFSKPVAITVT
jgi:plastocyanin